MGAASGSCRLHCCHDLVPGWEQLGQGLATNLQRSGVGGKASRADRIATGPPDRQESGVEAVTGADIEDNVDGNSGDKGQRTVDGYDRANRYVEMDIDANSGAIVRLDR